jgi:arylformamidase
MEWIDISVPIRPGMISFPGDPAVFMDRPIAIADGGVCNVSRLDFGVHSGTHVDAPVHFIEGAPGVDGMAIDSLVGPAWVVDATEQAADHIDVVDLDSFDIPGGVKRVLFKTPNSRLWGVPTFSPDFVALTAQAAAALVERGIVLVGADYLSIAPFGDPGPTHRAFLAAGVVILEGLDLRAVSPGAYHLICLPVLIPGSDGAPARAILRRPEED